jgi:glycosyltransferase involved in cell wall biosynthesis
MSSLLFLTHQFPLDNGDSAFIRNEISYVARHFDKVYIVCLTKRGNEQTIAVPENVSVFFYKKYYTRKSKLLTLFYSFFHRTFIKELFILTKSKKISKGTFFDAVDFYLNALAIKGFLRTILKKDKDINLIYTFWYLSETLAALLLKKQFNIKCITRTHNYDLYKFRTINHYQPFKKQMDKRIDKIFFVSLAGLKYYLNTYIPVKFTREKYSVFYLGIHGAKSMPYFSSERKETFSILSCSYIVPVKRVDFIIKALSLIDDISIDWTHIGDGDEKRNIQEEALNLLGTKKNISYDFKGIFTNAGVIEFYRNRQFDCFITTSEIEGLPVSIMEAMSNGIPAIGTNVGGIPEIITDKTGILLSANPEPEEIKNAIIKIYNLPEHEKTEMRKNAYKQWETHFNAETNANLFARELKNLSDN